MTTPDRAMARLRDMAAKDTGPGTPFGDDADMARTLLRLLDEGARREAALREILGGLAVIERGTRRDAGGHGFVREQLQSSLRQVDDLEEEVARQEKEVELWKVADRQAQQAEAERDAARKETADRDRELERFRAWAVERAAERHLLHSSPGREDAFWTCTKLTCQAASAFLRGVTRFRCKAREAGTAGGNVGQDCDWPWCGCYPEATAVLEAVEESGRFIPLDDPKLTELLCEALTRHAEASGSEVFRNDYVRNGQTLSTVWCAVGAKAAGAFKTMAVAWLRANGYTLDG